MKIDTETILFVLFITATPVIGELIRSYLGWRQNRRERKAFREYMESETQSIDER